MNLQEFREFIIAERKAQQEKNLTAIMSVVGATITDNNERKENYK